ncbi:MAG: PP2C family protein-serine/threonine phosphatase, partial [bacterium]
AEQKDGMDVALCVIDKSTNTLHFSGANNNLYLVRNKKLMVYRGDRMPIGISATTEVSFSSHEISLEENDAIYIFTDGFPDQFGGNNNKKFKYQRTRKLLSELNGITMSEQKEKIYRIFESWKGNSPQVDDILFIGFKVIDNDLNVSL